MGAYSKLHDKTFHAIKNVFPEIVIRENIRPDWLVSRNGTRLEIDLYLESMNIAIEIQGLQHYEFTPRFHKTYNDFLEQKDRDEQKRDLCYGKGIRLIEIASSMDLNIFINELRQTQAENKIKELKYFYQKPLPSTKGREKKQRSGKSILRFAKVRKWLKKKILIQKGLLPKPIVYKWLPLPGSQRQREYAKRTLQSNKMKDGRWVVWGGRNTHILEYIDGVLTCDCTHAQTVKTTCSHIIRTMIDSGTFPSREDMKEVVVEKTEYSDK